MITVPTQMISLMTIWRICCDPVKAYTWLRQRREPRRVFAFQYIGGPPGAGKTLLMFYLLRAAMHENQPHAVRRLIAVHSNKIEYEMADRMMKGTEYINERVIFLGHSLRYLIKDMALPVKWTVCSPCHMDEALLIEVLSENDIIAVGTVKKVDDLRRAAKNRIGQKLRFAYIFYDGFDRQHKLDFYAIAKVATRICKDRVFGDPRQTKFYVDTMLFENPDVDTFQNMAAYRASIELRKDMWTCYINFVKQKRNERRGKQFVDKLQASIEHPTKVGHSRRCHPDIVVRCSDAFYQGKMTTYTIAAGQSLWKEPEAFPFPDLKERLIFLQVDSATRETLCNSGGRRNDLEIEATQEIRSMLMSFGVDAKDILVMAAYALQPHRLNGETVSTAQGVERMIAVYSVTSYAQAKDNTGRLSLRGDTLSTAMTRAILTYLPTYLQFTQLSTNVGFPHEPNESVQCDGDLLDVTYVNSPADAEADAEANPLQTHESNRAAGAEASPDSANLELVCVACCERLPNRMMLPCRHLCLCAECVKSATSNGRCPMCTTEFTEVMEVHLP